MGFARPGNKGHGAGFVDIDNDGELDGRPAGRLRGERRRAIRRDQPCRQHFGLGKHTKIDSLEVRWPSGLKQVFTGLDVNQIFAVREE